MLFLASSCFVLERAIKLFFVYYSCFVFCRMLPDRFPTAVARFNVWRDCIGNSWCIIGCKNCIISGNFEEFYNLSCCSVQSRIHDVWLCYVCQSKCIPSFMCKQSLSQNQMSYTIYGHCRPFRLRRLNRIIEISNSTDVLKVYVPIIDHISIQKWRYIKFLWRPSQIEEMFFSQLLYSLMMAMIIISRCGDVEINPGPQTSKLKFTITLHILCLHQFYNNCMH